jgi:hypothetical protein
MFYKGPIMFCGNLFSQITHIFLLTQHIILKVIQVYIGAGIDISSGTGHSYSKCKTGLVAALPAVRPGSFLK